MGSGYGSNISDGVLVYCYPCKLNWCRGTIVVSWSAFWENASYPYDNHCAFQSEQSPGKVRIDRMITNAGHMSSWARGRGMLPQKF